MSTTTRGGLGPQGFRGPKGDQGLQGPTGQQGLKGHTGSIGIQGPTGQQGLKGHTGSIGIQGPTGEQGLKGHTGSIGIQGPTGEQGLKGHTGSIGIQGPTGQPGIQGKGFIVYKSGEGYPVSADFTGHEGEFYLKKGGDLYCYIPGTTGSTGAQDDLQDFKYVGDVTDESVLQGPKGDTGIQGPTGLKGDTGSIGIQGVKGDTGLQGPTGQQGIQGLPGPAGASTGDSIDPSLLNLKANLESPTFTGTVSGITSEMVKPNNILINNSDLDSSGNFILNSNNLKDGSTIISPNLLDITSPSLGNGLSADCFAISADPSSNDVYIGGGFTSVTNSDGIAVPGTAYICKYNTVTGLYSAVGNGLYNNVRIIVVIPNSNGTTDIYIGGLFTSAANSNGTIVTANRICKYNTGTKSYSKVGNGLNGTCFAICPIPNSNGSTDIYIGGQFTSATNSDNTVVAVNRICKYNTGNDSYSPVGNGLNSVCYAICPIPNSNGSTDIYIGGQFTSATNSDNTVVAVSKICKYNTGTNSYSAVGKGLDNIITSNYCYVICSIPNSTDIYIGGQFTRATNSDNTVVTVNYICKYNTGTNSYSAVKNGLQNVCNAICPVPNSNDIYIGGLFNSVYNTGTTAIPGTIGMCKYNTGTNSYSAVENGLNTNCYAMSAIPNSNGSTDIYIGGSFTSILYLNGSSLTVNRICKLNTIININSIQIYYKNTLISSMNYANPFEVIQKNTINSKEYITLVGSNKKFVI
jgi:nitrite reductase/ring-hydroxylating ferredoxin subunit